jgi:hypothetical protein
LRQEAEFSVLVTFEKEKRTKLLEKTIQNTGNSNIYFKTI